MSDELSVPVEDGKEYRLSYTGTTGEKALTRWADRAMYPSEPMPKTAGRVTPQVTLLNATPDPLGTLAATCAMYEGRVIRNLSEVTDAERRQALEDMGATALQGPLEVAQFNFLVEGVTRSFTHQMVRERQAFFAQESLRFAVVEGEGWDERAAMPPSIRGNPERESHWRSAMKYGQLEYSWMVDDGVPAEDARGVMPHDMTTRLHWVLDLRGLLHVAGLRTCTQAQFEWRMVMAQVAKALREYRTTIPDTPITFWGGRDAWQYELIADKLRPVCYQTGRCGFMAKFDRACSIRDRVEERAAHGATDTSQWHKPFLYDAVEYDPVSGMPRIVPKTSNAIQPWEWAADPGAAR